MLRQSLMSILRRFSATPQFSSKSHSSKSFQDQLSWHSNSYIHTYIYIPKINRNLIFRRNKVLIKELSTPASGSEEIHFPTRYSQSFMTQFFACLWKQHMSYWRNPLYNVVRFFFTAVTAFMFGTVYWKRGQKR